MRKLIPFLLLLIFTSSANAWEVIPDILLSDETNPNWVDGRRYTDIEDACNALVDTKAILRINKDMTLDNAIPTGDYSGVTLIIPADKTLTISRAGIYTFNLEVENTGSIIISNNITLAGSIFVNDIFTVFSGVSGTEILTLNGLLNTPDITQITNNLIIAGALTYSKTINMPNGLAALRNLDVSKISASTISYLKYRDTMHDGGHGKFIFSSVDLSTQVTNDTASGIYVAPNSDLTGVSGAWVRQNTDVFDPRWFGAKFNGSFNDAPAVQAAIDLGASDFALKFSGTPIFESTIVLPTDSIGIRLFAEERVLIQCNHNGDGIILNALNENYGGHVLENLWFKGPNTQFPSVGYIPVSTGNGINLETSFDNTFINVKSTGFQNGIYINGGFNNKCVGDCAFLFNQIGVLLEGGITNLNKFDGARIRQNRVGGVFINGNPSGVVPTGNTFIGAYIETNIPYFDGYPVGGPGDGSTSFAVKMTNTANNDFSGTYFENHEYDVWLGERAQGNKFFNTRHAWGSGRYAKIMFDGVSCNENKFNGAVMVTADTTTPSVESNNASQYYNSFIDCTGFNFIYSSITAEIFVERNKPFLLVYGTPDGSLCYPPEGYLSTSEGTARGKINGIGTATADLNVSGMSEILLGSGITGNTTIISFTNTKRRQIVTIWNYQESHDVIIKAGTKTDAILPFGLRDIVFDKYGQSVTFLVNSLGKAVEIGRNFPTMVNGTATISGTNTSTTVTFPTTEPDYSYRAFVTVTSADGSPALGSRRVYISSKGLSNMDIAVEVAPGVGNTVYIDWMTERDY